MGEKQDEVEKNNEGGGGPTTAVLKFELHCEGCVKKIKHFLRKTFDGVQTVKGDVGSNKLIVVGEVDPLKIKEKVEQKIKKKVALISPHPNKEGGENKYNEKNLSDKNESEVTPDAKMSDENDDKNNEHLVSTVVLKTRVHCDRCAQKIRKIVAKRDGVKDVDVDLQKDTITIKGTMNMKELLPYLNVKLNRVVELAPPPKKDEGDNKKLEEGGGENPTGKTKEGGVGVGNPPEKPKEGSGGGTEKPTEGGGENPSEKPKDESDKKEDGEDKKKEVEIGKKNPIDASEVDIPQENTTQVEINKLECSGYSHRGYEYEFGYGYSYTYDPRQYGEPQLVQNWHESGDSHPPQMFSDENPNACFIM